MVGKTPIRPIKGSQQDIMQCKYNVHKAIIREDSQADSTTVRVANPSAIQSKATRNELHLGYDFCS